MTGCHPLLLIEEAPVACARCGALLCLRKQVINLALGNDQAMHCLNCLGEEMGQAPEAVLKRLKDYVDGRDCFKKQWVKYETRDWCPDPSGCFPGDCF